VEGREALASEVPVLLGERVEEGDVTRKQATRGVMEATRLLLRHAALKGQCQRRRGW